MKTQPMDLTKPKWAWTHYHGRLRIAWISLHNWRLYGAVSWSWFFICVNNRTGGYWQMTILGLSIAYCYRKDFKQTKNKEMNQPLWSKLKEYEGNYPEDYSHENGNYMNICGRCGSYFIGHKRRVRCKICLTNRSETLNKTKR